MAEIKGIGGVFLFSSQAAVLADWYSGILGIEFERHPDGTDRFFRVFFTRDAETRQLRENPVFAINQADEPIRAGGPTYMLNLRVDDLTGFIEELLEKGVEVEPDVLVWERGKHAWIRDPDGNRIELYEEILV